MAVRSKCESLQETQAVLVPGTQTTALCSRLGEQCVQNLTGLIIFSQGMSPKDHGHCHPRDTVFSQVGQLTLLV